MPTKKRGENSSSMTDVKGYIDRIIFRNEDNGYTVLVLDLGGKDGW